MVQPAGTFGRKQIASSRPMEKAPQLSVKPQGAGHRSHFLATWLDRIFLWLPKAETPGLSAVGLTLLRQATLPFLVIVPFDLVGVLTGVLQSYSAAAPTWLKLSVGLFVFTAMALIQELSRYAFARRARQSVRALTLFGAVAIGSGLIFDFRCPAVWLWALAWQPVACLVIQWALANRRFMPAVLVALVVSHGASHLAVREWGVPQEAGARGTVPSVPRAGNMATWIKTYPGAVFRNGRAGSLGGLTTWRVSYTVNATPAQVDAFYSAVAAEQGFVETSTIIGLHTFRQASTGNRFRYQVNTHVGGAIVSYEALTRIP